MSEHEWTRFAGGECPFDEDALIDVRFDNGHVLENVSPWDVKWNGDNPGFGYVIGYRESATTQKKRA